MAQQIVTVHKAIQPDRQVIYIHVHMHEIRTISRWLVILVTFICSMLAQIYYSQYYKLTQHHEFEVYNLVMTVILC